MPESSILLGPRVIPLQSNRPYSLDHQFTSATLTYLDKSETSNARVENGDNNGQSISTTDQEELTEHDKEDVHRFSQTVSLISTRSKRDGNHTCGFFNGSAWTTEDEIPYGVTTFQVDCDGKGSIRRPNDDGVIPRQDPGTVTVDGPETETNKKVDEVDWNSMINFGEE